VYKLFAVNYLRDGQHEFIVGDTYDKYSEAFSVAKTLHKELLKEIRIKDSNEDTIFSTYITNNTITFLENVLAGKYKLEFPGSGSRVTLFINTNLAAGEYNFTDTK
jgi:hypothetical protein